MRASLQVEKFGQFVINKLRDRAIDFYDGLAAGRWKSDRTQELQAGLARLTDAQRLLIRRCVIAAVDDGLHNFLFALGVAHDFEEGIAVVVDGCNIAEHSDGLQGELFGEDGWFAKYSKQPEVGESP
jgi:hypothetical protein